MAELRPPAVGGHRLTAWLCRRELWVFWGVLLVLAAIGVRWLWLYRHGQPYDIDENGYLSIALGNHRSLFAGGVQGWWDSVLGPSVQAPLMTAATTPAFLLAGPNPIVGLLVPLAFGVIAVAATFLLGRRLGGPRVGWLAGLLAIGSPMLLNFSRSYNFAIAATAMLALALLAFARSDNLEGRGWSVALGLCLGLTALARTMALAFLPGVLLAMTVAIAAGPRRGRRAVNGAIAMVVALTVTWPWYSVNGSRVVDYLTSFGYGSRASEYGNAEPFLSLAAWRNTARYLAHSVFAPSLLVLALGAVALAAVLGPQIRRRGMGPCAAAAARSPLMPSVLLVLEGLAALTSSQNKGSAFVAPLIPAMAVCVAWAFVRLPVRPRQVLTMAAVLVVVVNVLAASDLGTPLARLRVVTLPELGRVPLLDGRGTLQQYEAALLVPADSEAQPLTRKEGRTWVAANAVAAALLRANDGPLVVSAFGFRHQLFNVNSVQLEELSAGAPQFPLVQVAPVATTDTVEGYAGWLIRGDAAGACNLLTATGITHEFPPAVTTAYMEAAAQQTGFVRVAEWPLPDERVVSLWRRDAHCP